MELRQLRYFVTVAEELTVTRAAARLMITTPSLSQQIKALERDLAVTLFDRSSKGVLLTPAGEELLPLARGVLAAAAELEETARRAAQGRAAVLRLGFLPFALTAASRRLLTEFGRAVPTVTLQIRQYEWDDPSAGLLRGETDAALVRPPFTGEDQLQLLPLAREPIVAVVAESHPVAGLAAVTRARLAAERWLETDLARDPVFAAFWYFHDLRDPATAVPTRASTVEEWLAEIAFGRGVDVVPASMAEEYRRPGLAFVPVADAPPSRLCLALHRRRPSRAGRVLLEYAASAQRRGDQWTTRSPTTPARISARNTSRAGSADSPSASMP